MFAEILDSSVRVIAYPIVILSCVLENIPEVTAQKVFTGCLHSSNENTLE